MALNGIKADDDWLLNQLLHLFEDLNLTAASLNNLEGFHLFSNLVWHKQTLSQHSGNVQKQLKEYGNCVSVSLQCQHCPDNNSAHAFHSVKIHFCAVKLPGWPYNMENSCRVGEKYGKCKF